MTPATFFASTSVPGDVTGTVPPTLGLEVGPGRVVRRVRAGPGARLRGDDGRRPCSRPPARPALTVTDPNATAPGHLVNGAFPLPSALQARATPDGVLAPVGGTPLDAADVGGPGSGRRVRHAGVHASRSAATDPLRAGTYRKTLTFTLSTTTP